ncbi:MAG: hypothetical protein LIP16_17740 [Clostridium sp.]|nr:hypothetical protein [Clostridium sp.]
MEKIKHYFSPALSFLIFVTVQREGKVVQKPASFIPGVLALMNQKCLAMNLFVSVNRLIPAFIYLGSASAKNPPIWKKYRT